MFINEKHLISLFNFFLKELTENFQLMSILYTFCIPAHELIIWSTTQDELMMMRRLRNIFQPAHSYISSIQLSHVKCIERSLSKMVWYWRTTIPLYFGGWVRTPYLTCYEVCSAHGKWLQRTLNFGTLWWNWSKTKCMTIW